MNEVRETKWIEAVQDKCLFLNQRAEEALSRLRDINDRTFGDAPIAVNKDALLNAPTSSVPSNVINNRLNELLNTLNTLHDEITRLNEYI